MYSTGESLAALPVYLSTRVAPELHDRILDHLHDSKKDLSVCSVVCKSWLPTCRFHLFAEVIYNPEFARFLDSSTHALNSITPYIKQVTMKGPFSQKDESYISSHSISRFKLEGVVKLHIETFNWESVESLNSTSSSFLIPETIFSHQLASLTLRFINFPSFAILTTFLDSFVVLQELSIFDVTWGAHHSLGGNASKESAVMKQSNLKKLYIERCNNQVLLNWLRFGVMSEATFQNLNGEQPHRSFPHLVTLSIYDILPGEGGMLSGFMSALGASLEYLEVGFLPYSFDYRNFNERIMNTVNLASNTNLKTVTIRQLMLFQFPSSDTDAMGGLTPHPSIPAPTKSPHACIPALLSTIQSHHLQTIKFYIWLSAEFHLDSVDWSQLADLFNRLEVPRISFSITGIGLSLVEDWFKKRLRTIDSTKTALEFALSY
ncbi:hypothetical protein BYT27DRAFT_7198706 [Phlegmacium glaucopus]|nr:hypothetical protein BYT27DRAFT_7198706 [Phlegmacium glaucopus]